MIAPETAWRRLLLAPLLPPSWAFGAAAAARRALYRHGVLAVERAPLPVISVGNLALGGTGKTPVVIALASRLRDRGHAVAVLSRGYRGSGEGPRIVSRGDGPLLPPSDAGDEPVLIARRCPGVHVLVGPRRADLARIAAQDLGASVAILDDGFQHLSLARDLDIVVLDAAAPLGNGFLVPRGPLREGAAALGRAHLVWIAKTDEGDPAIVEAAARLAEERTGMPPVRARYRVERVLLPDGRSGSLAGRSVATFAGIGRPSSFRALLEREGARVVAQSTFPDHHGVNARELERVRAGARAAGAELLCCTEKDAVKLGLLQGDPPIAVVGVSSEILAGEASLSACLERVAGARP